MVEVRMLRSFYTFSRGHNQPWCQQHVQRYELGGLWKMLPPSDVWTGGGRVSPLN